MFVVFDGVDDVAGLRSGILLHAINETVMTARSTAPLMRLCSLEMFVGMIFSLINFSSSKLANRGSDFPSIHCQRIAQR